LEAIVFNVSKSFITISRVRKDNAYNQHSALHAMHSAPRRLVNDLMI